MDRKSKVSRVIQCNLNLGKLFNFFHLLMNNENEKLYTTKITEILKLR